MEEQQGTLGMVCSDVIAVGAATGRRSYCNICCSDCIYFFINDSKDSLNSMTTSKLGYWT